MTSPAISVEGIGKLYQLAHQADRHTSFREALTAMALAPVRRFRQLRGTDASMEDFWALRDVSFAVQPGEVVGIVGRNGAGKSTLLKILSRIAEPTEGRAVMKGRIASLLEVGTGFHPELSGRENVYLNGSILGMKRREIAAKFDAIVAFAEVEKFLDTPVKRYSSGMYVRLAFAVAAHLDPEILIVDEVLAVGDAEFQKRCLGKMKEISEGGGRTVLFVSHNMAAVSALCSRAILLSNGRLTVDASPAEVIQRYLIPASFDAGAGVDLRVAPGRPVGKAAVFQSLRIRGAHGNSVTALLPGDAVMLDLGITLPASLRAPRIGVGVNNARGDRVFAVATYLSPKPLDRINAASTVQATFSLPPLYPGRYTLDVSMSAEDGSFMDLVESAAAFDVLQDGYLGSTQPYFPEMGMVLVPSEWHATPSKRVDTDPRPVDSLLSKA
jgi:lipopolysaccharide transport system ATP-binding protein